MVVVEHNHPAIIDPLIFSVVQKLMERDTRRSPYRDTVLPLAGTLFCPDCKRAMQLRSVKRGERKYHYYVCSTYKNGKGCSGHSIEQSKLEGIVLRTIVNQIQMIVEMDQLVQEIDTQTAGNLRVKGLDIKIAQKNADLDRLQEYRTKLYEALVEDLIDRNEFPPINAPKIHSPDSGDRREYSQTDLSEGKCLIQSGYRPKLGYAICKVSGYKGTVTGSCCDND